MRAEVIWLRTSPRNPTTGEPVQLLLAGGGQDMPYRHPVDGRQYRAGIVERPLFSAQLGFDERGWTGSTKPQTSVVSFSTADKALREQLLTLVWDSAPVAIEVGDEGQPPAIELVGKVKDAEFTRAGVALTILDLAEGLEKSVTTARFGGNGGIDGPQEAAGRIKRRSFGQVFNVEGRLIDVANSIYEFGDPQFGFGLWTALRDKGRQGSFTEVSWKGSVAATFAALQASNPADGGGVVAPSIACAKWWTRPSGPLTADFVGTLGTGGSISPAALAAAISSLANGPAVENLAEAIALRTAVAGIHISSDDETFAQALDRLLLGVSLLWLPQPNGKISIQPWSFDEAAPVLQGEFKGRSRTFPPHAQRRVGYQRNERLHSNSEIAGILLEELTDGSGDLSREDLLNDHQKWSDVQDDGGRPDNNATRNQSRGNYTASGTYLPGDMVVWTVASGGDGAGYTRIGIGETTGIPPSNTGKWALTVQRGQQGNSGNDGAPGAPATSAYLTNESATVWAYADGNVSGYGPATGQFKIFAGATDISASFALSTLANPQGLTVAYAGQTYTISGGFDPNEDTATLTIRATGSGAYAGKTFDKIFTLAKTRGGYEIANGLPSTNLFDGRQVWDQSDSRLKIYKVGIGWRPQIDVDSAINGAKLDSRTVTIEKLLVSPSNLVQNSDFGTGDLSGWRPFSNSQYIYIADSAIAPTDYVLRFSHPGGAPVFATIFAAEKAYSDAGAKDDGFRVVPGAQFNVKITARQSNWAGRLRVLAYFYKNDGAYTTNVGAIDTRSVSSDWNNATLTGSFTVPADCVRAWLYVRVDDMASGYIDVTNLWCARMADADLIVDGSILARNMAAGSVTADKIQAGAVTAAKLNVTALSAISADLGTVTAGRIIFNEGGFMRVQGLGFGSSNQFLEWFGPSQSNLNNCTEANAVTYLKKNGSAYFGGSLSAGVLKNAVQTTSLAANASVSTGTFSSNGNSRSVVVSFSSQRGVAISGSCNGSGTPAATVRLRRNGSIIQTWNLTGSISCVPGFGTSEPGTWQETIAGSWTYTDNTGGTSPEYTVELVSRTLSTPPTSTTGGVSHAQTLGVVSTEQ